MKSLLFLCAALILATTPAFAASKSGACYSQAQLQAEQILRLHSDLLVITLTCKIGSNGQDLPAAYGNFTKKNIRVLHDAEQTMIDYYRSKGPDPVGHLDHMRTLLANATTQKSADMGGALPFCAQYRDKVWQFEALSPADVQNEIQRMETSERSYQKLCSTHISTGKGK